MLVSETVVTDVVVKDVLPLVTVKVAVVLDVPLDVCDVVVFSAQMPHVTSHT